MGRKRNTDKHLPANVYLKSGMHYYVARDYETGKQKWIRLGREFGDAMIEYGKYADVGECRTMADVFDRYMLEVSPTKAPSTYKKEQSQIKLLRNVFGQMRPDRVESRDVYKYLDARGKNAPVAANRDISLLSDAFKYAISWGACTTNPCKGLMKKKETPRKRYITDEEFAAFADFAGEQITAYMEFKYLTGLRKSDILRLRLSDLRDDGIHVVVQKTQTPLVITWTHELKKSVRNVRALKRPVSGLFLFCTRKGQQYSVDGFSAIWKRKMRAALEAGVLAERFTEHDIRAILFVI